MPDLLPYGRMTQRPPAVSEVHVLWMTGLGCDKFKGIDIMRAVRSFDPCLPCGVQMYHGGGKLLETHHSPMFGAPR